MKKRFNVCLSIPVCIEVIGEDSCGEVNIVDVVNVQLPSVSDISDNLTDEDFMAIDKAFAEAEVIESWSDT